MPLNSPYPTASVARVPSPNDDGGVGGVLVPRAMGYLLVRITFHGRPEAGLGVRFYELGDDGSEGAAVGDKMKSDDDGLAGLDRLVAVAVYGCAIDGQPPTTVPTVHELGAPYPVVLPVGRPFVDVFESHEFAPADDGEG